MLLAIQYTNGYFKMMNINLLNILERTIAFECIKGPVLDDIIGW